MNLWSIHTVEHHHIVEKTFLIWKLSVSCYGKTFKIHKGEKRDIEQCEYYATFCKKEGSVPMCSLERKGTLGSD